MKICFTGDLFLGGDLKDKDTTGNIVSSTFLNADMRVVNLEQPISNNNITEDKGTLYTGSFAVKQLNQLKIDAVNLAHNHIQDKSIEGILETFMHLDNANIARFGAGKDIEEASRYYELSDDIVILGYCEFDKPYLKKILVAGENSTGINPLRYEKIINDLGNIPDGKKAILYFHWGREHVWLPPYSDIELTKKLLDHDKVLLIVGMHAHRIQGYIEHNGKRAYMCLGNFLFPNFYIEPPKNIYYPKNEENTYDVTYQYHSVSKITYKKWRLVNRISLILNYDTQTGIVEHQFVHQDDKKPIVSDLSGFKLWYISMMLYTLNLLYKLPKWLYILLEYINIKITYFLWRSKIIWFHARQMNMKKFFLKIIAKLGSYK